MDDFVDVHNTSEVLFHMCADTDPQRDSILTKGPADVLDHATSEIAIGGKLGIDATLENSPAKATTETGPLSYKWMRRPRRRLTGF